MRRIISIIGKPSSEKDARLNKFLEGREDYTLISVENMLRKEVENETKQGKLIKERMEAERPIPDYVVINLILGPLRAAKGNIIFNAFPMTKTQADAVFEVGFRIDRMINLHTADVNISVDFMSGYRSVEIRNINLKSDSIDTDLARAITEF